MSKQLLLDLNGSKNGSLKRFVDEYDDSPRIAWYPSAGKDFRALLYLHQNYSIFDPAIQPEPVPPDIFIFSDYYPWENLRFLDSRQIFSDNDTTISVDGIEELPPLNLPLHDHIVSFPKGSLATGRVIFMNVKITSNVLGEYRYPVIYAFVENESFYCEKLVPAQAIISHVIHVRYGGGLGGGGQAAGTWIINVLKKLNCEVFITDGHHSWQKGDDFALDYCPAIPKSSDIKLHPIREIHESKWSGHGDVSWNLIS